MLAGFISIDCGSNATRYEDPATGLIWLNDFKYTRTGFNGLVPNDVDSILDNSDALRSFRFFPKHRSKHCYDLQLSTSSDLVLIRAMFFRGNSSQLPLPIQFAVSVGANVWFTVKYSLEENDTLIDPIVREGIFHASAPIIYFCLLPDYGVPFISSLEVRPLDPGGVMYDFEDRDYLYLSTLMRLNTGPPNGAPTIRYPDDDYDRLWANALEYGFSEAGIETGVPFETTSLELNNVPVRVMLDGWDMIGDYNFASGDEFGTHFNVFFNFSFPQALNKDVYLYPIFYIEPSDHYWFDHDNHINILMNYELLGQFTVRNATARAFERLHLPNNVAYFKIMTTSPIICAIEFYEKCINDPSKTGHDLEGVNLLKEIYDMEDWQGDPCVPVPYNWLSCQSEYAGLSSPKRISSLTMSNLSNKDNLSKLPTVDLSLIVNLSLTYSQINDAIWYATVNAWSFKYLQTVNLSHNAMTSFTIKWGSRKPDWGSLRGTPDQLTSLDLSYNNFRSDISSLNRMVEVNLKLEELYLSDNLLRGEFPSNLYFNLTNIKILNIDRNAINGTLDLTIWRDNLLSAFNYSSIRSSTNGSSTNINQIFSLLDNNISDVNPSVDVLEPIIEMFLHQQDNFLSTRRTHENGLPVFNKGGVLLGGNPFCKSPQSRSQRYLCRSSLHEIVFELEQQENKAYTKPAFWGGASFVVCIVVVVIVVVLRKYFNERRSTLQILDDFKKKNVKPQCFPYSYIKKATQGFHKDNVLGEGGFGVVYKGILPENGTPIAVKKFFLSSSEEFLTEIVLISGMRHINIIQLTGCCIEIERLLVYEFVEQGNLAEALWGKDIMMNWNKRYNICVGIACALKYLHEELKPKIIHRDIKAENILLDNNFNPKLADFGLGKSILVEDNDTNITLNIRGTRGHIAPEYISQRILTEKADVYSFGVLVLEILSGRKFLDENLPDGHTSLKAWVDQLHEEGKFVNLLQKELQGECPEDQVLRLTEVAFVCVQIEHTSRPKMSEVYRMLVGNVNKNSFFNQNQGPPSNDTFVTDELDEWSSSDEDPASHPLLRSSRGHSDQSRSGATLELSDMSGR